MTEHALRAHAELSASGCARWWECPGSVRGSRGVERISSSYADEGTAAHELADACLTNGRNPSAFIGEVRNGFIITEEMATAVAVYVDHCRRVAAAADHVQTEMRFSLAALDPPGDMFGTADHVAYSRSRRELHISDLKYGRGVYVAARNNRQLLYYALGAICATAEPVSTVIMTIVQPRISGDVIRSAVIDAVELTEWSFDLMERARAALAPDAERVAGAHCKFCPCIPTCLAHQAWRHREAYRGFTAFDSSTDAGTGTTS